jgi:hypothetical protein
MRRLAALVLGTAVLLGSGPAWAAETITPGKLFYPQKVTKYEFKEDVVEGIRDMPYLDFLDSRLGTRFGTLVETRRDFNPEMLKDAEDL